MVQYMQYQCRIRYKIPVLQVMVACFHVFATWEEEYEKLQTLLRDMAKKKREEHGKAGRVNPSHKRSQARLDYVRK
jgi:dynein heavy chain 1